MTQKNIVVLTGAGISAESGIKTFRSDDGLWENHRIEDVAMPEGFFRNPKLVQDFYNSLRANLQKPSIQPNAAHLALAELEHNWPGEVLVVTQNVDNLHERAGSKNIIHMHGELLKVRCQKTEKIYDWKEDVLTGTKCPCCGKTGTLRPHIVWFGEMPFEMERIYAALEHCDVFLAIGTSGNVYPAAGFVRAVSPVTRTVELNLEPSLVHSEFKEEVVGPATRCVPQFIKELLAQNG